MTVAILIHRLFLSVLLLGLLLWAPVEDSCAYSVAVLPVADLTYDRDGVNFAVTEQLGEQLRRQGLDVINQNRVIEFMITEKIRRCNEIDSFSARKLATRLGSDTLLLTTLYQREKTADQSSIMVTLLDGKTGQAIWSETLSGHLNDAQPIFGISANNDLFTLQKDQLTELTQSLAKQQPALSDPLLDLSPVQIDDIRIDPPLVKGGRPVQCRVKIDFLEIPPDSIVLQGGAENVTLRPTGTANIYAATLTSRPAEGDHNIDITFSWPTGKSTDILNVGAYRVANTPVKLSLSFYNSIKVADIHTFSENIKIHPRIRPNRPLELWRITIYDNQGETVFSETQYTALPAEMLWRGTNKNQRHLGTGYYTLTLLVRDIAGNETQVTAKLYLQAETAEMVEVKQQVERGRPQLKLSTKETVLIPVDRWQLTLETAEGDLLLSRKGMQLPATIALPERLTRHDVVCHFIVQDKLGNSYTTETVQREAKNATGEIVQLEKKVSNWKADF